MNAMSYTEILNPAQLEAVSTVEGPLLLIAGAGSGKTRTLIYRVAHLVESGIAPEAILLLTFTRKAAQEMLERAAQLADPRCRLVSGGTFHALANRVLREHGRHLGYGNGFTILDRADMEDILHSLVPDIKLPLEGPRFPRKGTVANVLSKAANLRQPLDIILGDEYPQFIEFTPQLQQLQTLYRTYKQRHQMVDYDDLILLLLTLLQHHADVREALSRQYRFLMVDEYQDTNAIQAEIIHWLGHEHRNVMVVGDDSQSIYSFRGANYKNMFEFSQLFPDARLIKLEENYRSRQPILDFTNALIEGARVKFTKCLYTRRTGGDVPRVVDTGTEPSQARYVTQQIRAELAQGRSLKDLAVLFRAGYHSFELEAELSRQGIPYIKYGGFKFLESAHIKDFLAHLRVICNREDMVSWVRVLRLVRQIGQARIRHITDWMRSQGLPPERLADWPGLRPKDDGLRRLAALLARIAPLHSQPRQAAEAVLAYYNPLLEAKYDDFPRRRKELEQLLGMAARYRALKPFLEDLVLEPPDSIVDMESGPARETLTLSTVHSAKGLEWPVVFIIWVAEGRFPMVRASDKPEALEEERRLMYVAATRAKDRLLLCYPGQEALPVWQMDLAGGGQTGLSSLLRDLDHAILAHERLAPESGDALFSRGPFRRPARPETPLPAGPRAGGGTPSGAAAAFARGDRVSHPAFGMGVISRLVAQDKVEVLFRNFGRKLLHLEYTALEKV